MHKAGTTIAKNAGALLGSQLVTWALTLALTLVLPRYVGPSGVGEIQIAQSIWMVLGVLIACGMDMLLVKAIARDPARIGSLVGSSFALRGGLFLLSCLAAALYLSLHQFPPVITALVVLCGIAQLFNQFASASSAALQGLEQMGAVSVATIVSKVVNTGLGIAVLMLGYGVYGVAFVSILSVLALFLIQFVALRRTTGLRLRAGEPPLGLLRAGSPYLFSGLTLALYSQIDVLIISTLVNTTVVGWYSAALLLFGTLQFVPVALTTSLFPALTRSVKSDPARAAELLRRSFDLMLLVSVPIGLGLLVVGQPLMVLLYGPEFAPSGVVLAVLGLVVPMTYLNILLGRFLIAADRQVTWTVVMIGATLITVPLDLWLVPLCQSLYGNGALGGAFSFVIAELGMTLAGLALLPRGVLGRANALTALRTVAAGALMAAACWWFREMFVAVPVLVGAAVYSALALLLRAVPPADLALARDLARRMFARGWGLGTRG
ncbi:MAG TPA: flippase [Roseiflexaceae bacterium]|nr:flippase [Roseiflexaceae bacterium]